MQVEDCLTDCGAIVDGQPERVAMTFLLSYPRRSQHDLTQQFRILASRARDHAYRFLRADEDMHRGLRIDIPKGNAALVFEDDIGRDFARGCFLGIAAVCFCSTAVKS